jgi:hypothetical protein
VLQLAKQHGVAKMKIGSSGVKPCFHAQGHACGAELLKFGAEIGFANDLGGTLFYVRKLIVDLSELGHEKEIITISGCTFQIADFSEVACGHKTV